MLANHSPDERPRVERLREENRRLQEQLTRREQELLAVNQHAAVVLNEYVTRLQELEKRTRQLEAIVQVANALSGLEEPQQVQETALEQALEVLGQDSGTIYLVEGEELVLKAHRNLTPEMMAELGRMSLGQSIAGRVAQSGQPILVAELADDPRVTVRSPLAAGHRSVACVPLRWRGETLGALAVSSRTPGTLDQEEFHTLIALATPLAFHIAHSRQDAVLREKVEELSLLTRLSARLGASPKIEEVYQAFVAELKGVADIARAVLLLPEGEGARVISLYSEVDSPWGPGDVVPLPGSAVGHMLSRGETVYRPDLAQESGFWTSAVLREKGLRSVLDIPLKHRGQVIGAFALCSRQPHAYDCPRLHRVLEEAADILAGAVATDGLLRQLQDKVERLSLLAGLTATISASPDIQEVYDSFARSLKAIAPVENAALLLMEEDRMGVLALSSEVGLPWGVGLRLPITGSEAEWAKANRTYHYQPDLAQQQRFWTDNRLLEKGFRSVLRLPLLHQGEVFGVVSLASRQPNAFSEQALSVLEELARQLAPAVVNRLLYLEVLGSKERLEGHVAELERATVEVGMAWVRAWEARYPHHRGHSARVAHYATLIARRLGLSLKLR